FHHRSMGHSFRLASRLYARSMQNDFGESRGKVEGEAQGDGPPAPPGDTADAIDNPEPRTLNRAVPLVLAIALFMEQMDSTVIATSLPAIADDIGTTAVALKLALTSYLVSLAIFIPVSGWMADRFGAKNVFRAALMV